MFGRTDTTVNGYPDDGWIHELELQVVMGSDDLRGGEDNIDLMLTTHDGMTRHYADINRGQRWAPETAYPARVVLDPPVAFEAITEFSLTAMVTGGIDGDIIDIDGITVLGHGGTRSWAIATIGALRFTGTFRSLTVPVGHPTLVLTIVTDDDDLRGGGDNLDVVVRRVSGRDLTFRNVNADRRWADHSRHEVALELPDGTAAEDLRELVLRARVSAGWNGDNWTMAGLDARLCLGGDETPVFHHGFERFHGRDRDLVIPRT